MLSNIGTSGSGRESSHRSTRRGHRSSRSGTGTGDNRSQPNPTRLHQDRKQTSTKAPSQTSSSRPPTPAASTSLPARPTTPGGKQGRSRREPQPPLPPRSPTSSVAVESDLGSGSQDAVSVSPLLSPPSLQALPASTPSAPPGLPAAPPGLVTSQAAAPGSASISSTATIRDQSATSYQMSTQARALLDDVTSRRESVNVSLAFSPFPDLDRTLQSLTGGVGDSGGFNFNLDPKLALDDDQIEGTMSAFGTDSNQQLSGISFDPFAAVHQSSYSPSNASSSFGPPPGLTSSSNSSRASYDPATIKISALDRQPSSSSGYVGLFNPFAESSDAVSQSPIQRPSSTLNDDTARRVSRFGFARERQGSGLSTTSSPMLSADVSLSSMSEGSPSAASATAPWPFQRHHEFGPPPGLPARANTPGSRNSPLVPYAAPQSSYGHQPSRFQPFDMEPTEASLKDILGIGRERSNSTRASPYGRRLLFV